MKGAHAFHMAGEKYLSAVAEAAGAIPFVIPVIGPLLDLQQLLERVDGLLLTGSASNVAPHLYGGEPSAPGTLHDPERDATTLPLIPLAVSSRVPLLGVCRGFQEMNVAFGGTLWQKVQDEPGHLDHREDPAEPLDQQYAERHEVVLTPGGMLRGLAERDRIQVNSLHSQGVRELGQGLEVEARAPDGLIEAFRVRDARNFALAVQWHPEWQAMNSSFSRALFAAFGAAAAERALSRRW